MVERNSSSEGIYLPTLLLSVCMHGRCFTVSESGRWYAGSGSVLLCKWSSRHGTLVRRSHARIMCKQLPTTLCSQCHGRWSVLQGGQRTADIDVLCKNHSEHGVTQNGGRTDCKQSFVVFCCKKPQESLRDCFAVDCRQVSVTFCRKAHKEPGGTYWLWSASN